MIGQSIESWLLPDMADDNPQDETVLRINFSGDEILIRDFKSNCIHDEIGGNYVAKDDIERYLQDFKDLPAAELETIKQNLNNQL